MMGNLIVTDRDGTKSTVEIDPGDHLMEALKEAGMVRGECGGMMICSTCHVLIADNWYDKVGTVQTDEIDLIDGTGNYRENASRLGCQIEFTEELDGLELTIGPDI